MGRRRSTYYVWDDPGDISTDSIGYKNINSYRVNARVLYRPRSNYRRVKKVNRIMCMYTYLDIE